MIETITTYYYNIAAFLYSQALLLLSAYDIFTAFVCANMFVLTVGCHATTAFLGYYLFILFSWWWIAQGDASAVYKYTCWLMLGIATTHTTAVWTYLSMPEGGIKDAMCEWPWWWPGRHSLIIVPLLLLSIYATKKIYYEYMAEKQMRYDIDRRKNPRKQAKINGIEKERK